MHELSIAQEILEIVQQYVPADRAAATRAIRVRVGQMSGVVPESLRFSFEAIVSETPWQNARLDIERVPTTARCNGCGVQFEIEDIAFFCPSCHGTDIRLVSGTDLHVAEIEMDEEQSEAL